MAPFKPEDWEGQVVVSRRVGSLRENTDLSVDDDTYISWAVTNTGPSRIEQSFYVDLQFDGFVVERWPVGSDLKVGWYVPVEQWEELPHRTRVTAGEHTLTLVVDSTNLVPETDEADNVFTQSFTWAPGDQEPITPQDLSRAPDLAPFAHEGWSGPLVATSYEGAAADGPLSVDVPSYIWYGVQNQGLASTADDFWVYLYLDDILVKMVRWGGMLAEASSARTEWGELFDVTNVPEGTHTLKVVVDATDLVDESDEENNVFEKQFTWDSGPVPSMPIETPTTTPTPTPPAPLTLPNLVPGWRFGSDGPIVLSQEQDTLLDSQLVAGGPVYVDLRVHNQSIVEAPPFEVELYFDGQRINTFESSGELRGGWSLLWKDEDVLTQLPQIAEGTHTLTLVIDPTDAVQEANEDDNVYEKTVVWTSVDAPTEPELTVYTDEELRQILSNLQTVLDTREDALSPDGADHTSDVLSVADAGYYLLTGRSLQDERVNIFLLTHDKYLEWIDGNFAEDFAVSDESEYPAILATREFFKTDATGFTTRRSGSVAVAVDAERAVARVINTLVHELGHMRQDLVNAAQSEAGGSHFLDALHEAEAQQFERAFWLKIEDFTGLSLLAYPDFEGFEEIIDYRFETWEAEKDTDEHSLGYLLLWLAVLDDPELSGLKAELIETGRLAAPSSLQLYDRLVDLAPQVVDSYASDRLNSLETWRSKMRELSKGRLVPDSELQGEGAAALREPGLITP